MSQNYNCVAPEPFNFSNPGDWPKWIRRFERFRQASGLINNPENEQVNMLVYCMGDNADDILLSCKIASDQLENYGKVIECFESHFIPRRNIIYERARFNQRCQQEGEKVNEFITALHSLAEHCNFGMLHDELIRDRIVVEVRDRALSERMQLDTDLTLVKATLMAKQLESVKEQQSSLYQQDSIDQIKKMPNHIKETKRHEQKIRQFKSNQLGGSSHGCTRCGNSNNHDWKNCPAMNSYCSKCKKKGHYAKVCRSEAINEIKSEIAFLGSIEDNSKKWIVPIKVNNRQINFKIDTGADVNVLPLQYYYQSFQRIKLEKSDKILQGPNGIPLETVGMIHVKLQNKGQHLNSKIYIVDKLKQPLLSGETSEKLNIVRMIQQFSSGGRGGQRGRLGSGDNRGCYNCGEEGHRKFECTKPGRGGWTWPWTEPRWRQQQHLLQLRRSWPPNLQLWYLKRRDDQGSVGSWSENFNLSEKLQLESELTLEKAIQIVRQSESVKNQQKEIRQDTDNRNVDVINRKGGRDGTIFQKSRMKGHSKEQCPAKDAICNKCRKKGHFAKVCHTKTVQEVSSSQNYAFIGIVGMQENAEDKWCEVIKVNDQPIKFKIDTGAEVSVMPEGIYLQHFGYLKTEKADKNLFAVSKKIEVNGMFQAFLESKRQKCEETIYIVKGVARPLLSCRASEILGLVWRINIVEDHTPTKLDPMLKFPKLFNGLGKLDIPYEIKLKEGAKPYSIYTPRRVPIPLMKELQMELERMTSNGVIEKVEGSSEWCSPMVLVAKPSGKLRICVDLSILNKNILREIHPIPVVEHTLAQLKGAKVFTKLDANSGFWQIPLSSESSALTTFITPFGRFRFKRLPFGISSAPEIFQKRMGQILEGLEGTLCHMDDIMVYGSCQEEHDKRLETVLTRVSKSGLTLNKDKCKFAVTTIKFLGHQIGPNGIQVDPKRKLAILEFPKPRSVKELKQFLGMVNFSARFVPNLAEIAHPMNKLLSKKEEWIWGDDQDRAFDQIKENLTSAQGLALYDPSLPITVSADASSFGLGAVIWQTKDGLRQVIAYASRTLSETEKRYAQIEKEALAITWACEKFKQYIQGLVITLETDHKPLVPIFTSKNIDDLTPRIQRLRLRIMRYSYKIVHTPGKNLIVADALSRSPRMKVGTQELEEELCAYVQQVVSFMPISDVRVKEIKESQDKDQVIQNIIKYTQEGWPERTNVSMSESQYWPAKDDFSVENGILLKGSRYVISENIRKGLLQRIHEGHLGIVKCRERAKGSVWWPRITSEIEEMVRTCPMCIEERTNRHQPLLPSELPNCPWEKVGVDLFTLKGQNYLLIADYYSRYPEIARLEDMTSASVIVHCKSIFARHGIPLEVRSDNGPQFGSLFKEFAHEYGFTHVTSSPRYPQSNGFTESFVKIVKERISKSKDPYLALLAYRATPLANGFSPAELSMGRRVRTTIPTPTKQHQPPNLKNLKNQEAIQREKQKYYFDRAKGVRELPPLDVNDRVWLTDLKTPGVIISKADTPRSYMVDTPRGSVRRNRFHLLPTGQRSPGPPHFEPDEEPYVNYPEANTHTSDAPTDVTDSSTSPKEALYRTRSGRTSENIRRMVWPARSPDLNPIEHVWDALGRRIGALHPSPRTLVELRTALLEEWGLLPLDLLQSL
ncbi:K02A2.6-like, partial [Cordylochernes scorpioides]